tara:strand:- start:26581 stop:28050 length:1470 start_codon:yes stop_codon:yes gene_type:complete
MFYIFEMANNHQGSVAHAKLIIDKFSSVAKQKKIDAAIKLQFRQLDSFIHKDFKKSDLKFVKRFNSTRLTKKQFQEIIQYTKQKGLLPMATPFDNESLHWLSDLNVPIVKVASCSIDDWVLLEELSNINKKIIISTGGASIKVLKKVYDLFKSKKRDFAFMHCVGEYPTPIENSNLNRITLLKETFPDIEIGFSTHEAPQAKTMCPHAVAMGCTIIEKHVGVETEEIKLNLYSNTPEQMANVIDEVGLIEKAMMGVSNSEKDSLSKLKRGAYVKKTLPEGTVLKREHFYYCMPKQENQLDASDCYKLFDKKLKKKIEKDAPITADHIDNEHSELILQIVKKANKILNNSKVPIYGNEKVEISCHYGIENFFKKGALIIDKINREYCKKIIVMFPEQSHPVHRHIKKEEAFELLSGDCTLNLNGTDITLKKGKPVLIARGVNHSFKSKNGCVIEEVSTTHVIGDSIYTDPLINSLKTEERKIKISLKEIL